MLDWTNDSELGGNVTEGGNVTVGGNVTTERASIFTLTVYFSFLVEGAGMILGNGFLIIAILTQKKLRRHEYLMVAGLALGDLIYGVGFFFAGILRFRLGLAGQHMSQVTRWACMLKEQTPFFIFGSQAAGFMMVMMSVDRLLAVRWFAFYMGLNNSYVKKVVAVVFGYVSLTLIGTYFMSAFMTSDLGTVAAICISTQVGPMWFGSYQPTVQMTCGISSVLIFCLTWLFHRQHVIKVSDRMKSRERKNLQKQRRMTKIVGITVLVTFMCYVVPHLMILISNTVGAKKTASFLSPFAWAIGNLNSIVNIFIFGTAIRDLRVTIVAYLHCRKPDFNGKFKTVTGAPTSDRRSGKVSSQKMEDEPVRVTPKQKNQIQNLEEE